ncbi:MAG: hypothetical protein AVDCRST_MAG91-3377 [uncultured Sphingomonadaceae bacterium]|uniref:Uncharacterized protein n=1 Tax=uncultured Sphingomonadaceae bacterium TaxID=169976 RepID=A0A6J4U122_9SPHN|nr:MAG: hypothetical protein AVDCRST_MAG91-3377 [uncultured Sphingomonadaceae bacterium]
MAANMRHDGGHGRVPWRVVGWGAAALLLSLPAIAMRFTAEVDWDETDFIVMGIMIAAVGLGIEFLVRKSNSLAYRLGAVLALLTAFLTIWANLAVGMIGSEDNGFNLLFGGMLAVALTGAAVSKFEPAGMARATVVTAIVQAMVSAVGLSADVRGGVFSMAFAGLWLLAAFLFRKAARETARVDATV